MAKTHWKKLTNPDYLGAYAFEEGEERILTIQHVKNEMIAGTDGKKEECQVAYFFEKEKPMVLNKVNMKTITKLYKTPYIEDWQGKKIIIHVQKVKAFGELVEALRIKSIIPSNITTAEIKCEKCNNLIQPVGNMSSEQLAEYTKKKYDLAVCADCATAISNELKKKQELEQSVSESEQTEQDNPINEESESVTDESNENID